MMRRFLPIITLFAFLSACVTDSALSEQEQKLLWIENADPQEDAQKALGRGDFRMMGLAQRAIIIPGVPKDQMQSYEIKCGVNVIDGVTDTVLNKNHMRLIKQAHRYALQYNAIVKQRCLP